MKPHLPIKLFVALCAAISAVAATTQAAITVTNITQWDGYDQAAGAAHVGNIDGTIYNAKQQQDYLWNKYWNFIYTVDAATLTEGTYSLDTVALTQFGEEGYVVASSLVMGSDGTGTVSLGGWDQPAATAEVDLSNAKDITFVLSRNNNGGIVSLTGYVDGDFDTAAFTLPISGVNLSFASGYISTVSYGSTGGLSPNNNSRNTYRQVADNTVGSFDITKAGYLLGSQITATDLSRYYTPVTTLVWNGEAPSATWDTTSESWLDGEQPARYVSGYGTTANFNTGEFAKDVIVSGDIKAAVVNVNDGYTFTVESGSSLTLDALTVANGMTATVAGTGSITLNSLTGALAIEEGSTVNLDGTVMLTGTQTLQVSGEGTLDVTTLRVTGGEHVISSNLVVTGGGDGMGATNRSLGLAVTNAAATVTLAGDTYITGALYNQVGTVNIGNGTDAVRVETNRVEFGDTAGIGESILNVNKNAALHVKAGDEINAYPNTGLVMGEWNGVSTVNIAGKLYADNATAYVGDNLVTFNIEKGGLMAVKGFSLNQKYGSYKAQTINLNLLDGGTLVLGENGIASQKPINIDFASGEVGISANDVTIAKDIVLSGTTTFNTTKYEWQGYDDTLELTPGEAGGTLTISGNISGEGTIIKEGTGTLILDGTITFGQNAIQNNGSGTITFGDNIHFDLTGMVPTRNVYTLFSGTGAAIDLSGFDKSYITVAGGTEGHDWVFGKNGTITFDLGPELTWNGAMSRRWNTAEANWTDGGASTTFRNTSPVVFGDTGSGNVILEGTLAPYSVLVDNSFNYDYTFTGDGKLTGAMQLTKEGDGTLTISTANDYTGGTIINGGVVVVDNATALGSGDVALNGVELDIATDATISGHITVEGDNYLIVEDGCTLSLGNRIANNYYLEMWGTYDISNLSAEVLESEFVGGAVKGNGFVSNELQVQVVDNSFGAYAEMGYGTFLYNGIEGEAGVDGEVMVTEVNGSVFYVNNGTDKVSKAFKDYSPASILMQNGTGLDLDKASADIPNIELVADALTAALNVKQTSTIESLSGGDESSTLTINGTTEKTLTLVDASGYNGSLVLSGGAVTAGSANAFGTSNVSLSGATLDLGGFEFANSVNVTGEATIGHGTLTGSISLTDAALQVGSDLTAEGSLTTNGSSSIGVSQDATLTLMQTITNEGSALSLSGAFDVSVLSTVERDHTYTGGATIGNGFYTGNLGIQVVNNTQGGTSNLTNGTFLYNGEEWAAGNDGYAVKSTVDYSKFYVNSGTEGVLQAYGDHTPDTIVLKRATGLNLDATDIELPNIELAANEDTAYLNVMQDTTIDSITGGDGSFILNVYGTDDKTLTLMDASGYVGSMVFDGGTVAVGSATAFGASKIWVSDTTLDLGGFEVANAMNLAGDTTVGNGTLTGSLSAYNTTLHVGSDATVNGTLTTDGTSGIEVSQDAALTLGRVIQNTGDLALSGTFDISALSSIEREPEYIGGTTEGNGFLSQSRDIEVVNNTQGGTSDLTNGTFIYNGETADSVSGGTASLTSVDYSHFFVFTGEESLGAALDTASAAGEEVGGVTMSAGTILHVDRDMSADFVSVASGSVKLDIKGTSTVTEGATPHSEYILTGSGVYALASGNTELAPTLDSEGWTGTVAFKDVVMNNPDFLDLDNYGHEGSAVRLDGVKANFGADSNTFSTALELTGDGLEITACQGNRSYEFAGGVKGDGNFIYNLTTPASNQTYIFSGDVSDWTGAYVSAANKTSTLQFQDDATVMGADIIREQGVVNVVVVGDEEKEHTTVFKGDVQASNLTVQENAKAVIEGNAVIEKTANRTGILSLQGTLEVADGGSLALSQDAAVQVGNAFTVTGKGDTAPALSGNLEITEGGFYGIGDKAARIDHSVIKLEEGASVVFDNVILGASSQLKDDPATVVVNNMVIEGILGENVQEGEPLTIKSGSVLHLTGNPGQTVVIEEDSFACTFDITNVQDVQLSGNCLTIDLASMYPKFKDMGESFDWLGIALGSGDHAPTIDENLEVMVQTLPNQRAHGYVGWGGTFVTVPEHGENVGPVIYFHMYEVPEPATSTLSLLALAALATRRRRAR